MNSLWYLYDKELTNEICQEVLKHWNDFEAQKGKVGNDIYNKDLSIRNSKINKFPYSCPQQKVFNELLEPYITVANRECFGFNLNGFSEFQIAEYTKNDFYSEHIDSNTNDTASQRKISVTVQLSNSEEYEGGDFIFGCNINNPSKESMRNKGSILCFPSFVPHRIDKVTQGKRYALVGWYEGKKWQ